jgi:hypothetical protein
VQHNLDAFRRDLEVESQKVRSKPGSKNQQNIRAQDQEKIFIQKYRRLHMVKRLPYKQVSSCVRR